MQQIILSKDWNKHKEGTTVTVDDLRAAWLKKAGFEAKKGKKSKRVFFRPIPGSHAPALANRRPSVLRRIAASVTTASRSTFPREKVGRLARSCFPLHRFPKKFDSLGRGLVIAQRDSGGGSVLCPLCPQKQTLERVSLNVRF